MAAEYNENKLTKLAALKALAERIKGEYDELDTKVDGIISTGGEPNKIDSIEVNGEVKVPDGQKKVSITVPKKVSELEDHGDYATKEEMNSKISSVYKPGGSKTFSQLPTPGADYLGLVYNVTDEFTTTSSFVEGANNKYQKGTNVVVVQDGGAYKFDVLAGFVDLSGYATDSGVDAKLKSYAKSTDLANYVQSGDLQDYVQTSALDEYVTDAELTAKDYATNSGVKAGYVAKDGGKGLSDCNYTQAEKTKLGNIEIAENTEVEAMLNEVFGEA